jgi:WD40 repeat protein
MCCSENRKKRRSKRLLAFLVATLILGLSGCRGFMPAQSPLLNLEGAHPFGTTRLAFDRHGRRLASGGFSGEIIIWAVPSGKRLIKLHPFVLGVRELLWGKAIVGLAWLDDSHLVSGLKSGRIVLWNVHDGKRLNSIKASSALNSLVLIPNQAIVVTGHRDGKIRAFSLPHLLVTSEFNMGATVLSLAYDRVFERLAASAKGGRVAIFTREMRLIRDLDPAPLDTYEIRFAPDGQQLAGGTQSKLLFWDLQSGQVRIKDTGHLGAVTSIDYSPNGEHLVSLGRFTDSSIRLLNLESGMLERRLASHGLCGKAIRFSPDGRFVASGGDDRSVRLYDISAPSVER